MTTRIRLALAAGFLLMTGCAVAPQRAIPVNTTAISPSTKIGVVMTQLPPVNTHLPGAGCLLCLAAAEIANSALTTHAKTLPLEGIGELDKKLAEALNARGLTATVIPQRIVLAQLPKNTSAGPDKPARSFTALGRQHKVDKLLVVQLDAVGFLRTYANYFPTSDPKAWIKGAGYIVDVQTNAYEWYLPIEVQKSSAGGWDEAPKFPGLTNAYFQAVELALDSYLNPFRDAALATSTPAPAAAAPTETSAPAAAPAPAPTP